MENDWYKDFEESNEILHAQDITENGENTDIFHYNAINCILNVENGNDLANENESSVVGLNNLPVSSVPVTSDDQSVNNNARVIDLENKVSQLNDTIKKLEKNQYRLKKMMNEAEEMIEEQSESIFRLEENLSRLDQYGRRENVEFQGISESVPDNKLESTIIEILKKIGLHHIQHYHIVACHRIGKPSNKHPRSVIVRFINRKDAIKCLQNKANIDRCSELGMDNLSINENLCPAYKSIYENLNKLKNKRKISRIWTHNGMVNFKFNDSNNEKGKRITHDYYFREYFPNEF